MSIHIIKDINSPYMDACRYIRKVVFEDEQHVPHEEEFDTLDQSATHILITDTRNNPIATGRLLSEPNKIYRIGRVAVIKEKRQYGYGKQIVSNLIKEAKACGAKQIVLDAQVSAMKFYVNLGFQAEGPEFQEAGITHRFMKLKLN